MGGLKKDNKLIHFLVVWLLCPRASNHAQCSETDLIIIYGIVNEIMIHLPNIICDTMMKAKGFTHYHFSYALLVSGVCEYKGVHVSNETF